MRLEALFHLSFYVTLALAAGCLALPATFFLWWMPFLLIAILTLIILAWRHENIWVISEAAANQIGVFIAVGAAGWILFQIPRSVDDVAIGGVNWPAGLLPHLGPLLMVLLVVKLFRPKRLPDYWVIQTMGLMMVALAAVISDEFWFGPLVSVYFACLIWSLALYYPVREQAIAVKGSSASLMTLFAHRQSSAPLPWRFWGLPRAACWTATVFAVGFIVYLTAPRQAQSQWNARQLSNYSSGAFKSTIEASIDLNRTGLVELSEEPAFSVSITNSAGRPIDAASVKRWRQEVLELYAGGRWFPSFANNQDHSFKNQVRANLVLPRAEPLAPAEGEWLVTFQVKPSVAGGLVLAEPLQLEPNRIGDPHLDGKLFTSGIFAILQGCDTFVPAFPQGGRRTFTYSQLVMAQDIGSLTPARDIHPQYASFLANQRAPKGLADWTVNLLQELPELGEADYRLDTGRLDPAVHAQVAKALCRRLAQSNDYRYSLDLRREQQQLDPTVDFLMNVKEGHCERFAGGLALMLRSLGVPCRVVKGYLGADSDETGHSFVRFSQAHTWVQVLVEGELPGSWRWLTLDPTPSNEASSNQFMLWWRWCRDNLLDTHAMWRQFIMDYTPDQQAEFLGALLRAAVSKRGLMILAVLAGVATLVLGRRRLVRWSTATVQRWYGGAHATPCIAFYEEFLCLVQCGSGLKPRPGQTPREFAVEVATWLRGQTGSAELMHVPEHIVRSFYRERFAGHSMNDLERTDLGESLAALRVYLSPLKA